MEPTRFAVDAPWQCDLFVSSRISGIDTKCGPSEHRDKVKGKWVVVFDFISLHFLHHYLLESCLWLADIRFSRHVIGSFVAG